MIKKQPLVSVIMPVYNGARYVEKAIDSVIGQTYPRVELIVCDDGSTDRTWEILKSYRKQYPTLIRIIRLPKNRGESVAANTAYAKAKGAYIARLDADDVAHRLRLERQVAYMQTHPGVIALGSQARVIDGSGRTLGHKSAPIGHDAIYTAFAYINPMIHPSVMFRKSLLPKREYLYRSNFESTDDYHTYFELLNHGRFENLPDELVSYRIHGKNKSLTDMKEKFWTDTKVRLAAVSRMGYRAPILMFPAIAVQMTIVSLLPEAWLRELFYYVRGIKKLTFHVSVTFPHVMFDKLKAYAATFLT